MKLRKVKRCPSPAYPTFEEFHRDRGRYRSTLAQGAGLLLAAGALAGCDASSADKPDRLPGTPPPPPPPVERLRGEIAVPEPPKIGTGAACDPAKPPPPPATPAATLGRIVSPQPPVPPAGAPPPPKVPTVEQPVSLPGDIKAAEPPRLSGKPAQPTPPAEEPKDKQE